MPDPVAGGEAALDPGRACLPLPAASHEPNVARVAPADIA